MAYGPFAAGLAFYRDAMAESSRTTTRAGELKCVAIKMGSSSVFIPRQYHPAAWSNNRIARRPAGCLVRDVSVKLCSRSRPSLSQRSTFIGFRFPAEVIVLAVRWYLRCGLSYRDVEELLAGRGIDVDHVTVYRWVHRFTPLLADAAHFVWHAPGERWFVDETYVKINGVRRNVYRAVDQHGQVIDVLMSKRRDAHAARLFSTRVLATLTVTPCEVVTDAAPVYPRVLDELVPAAWHHVERWANNRIEADHSRLKHRLRPMHGLHTDRTAQIIIAGLAFLQNLRRGHYELGVDTAQVSRLATAFAELAQAIWSRAWIPTSARPPMT